jgi:hypothetical protein
MNQLLLGTITAVVLVGLVSTAAVMSEREGGAQFIAGNGPVSEDQIKQKLASEGWSNVQIAREGQVFHVLASKDQQTRHIAIDSRNGRLLDGEGDDD